MSDIPTTDESEIDEPTDETVDPDKGREIKAGVGYHDEAATILDRESPDTDNVDEPNVAEPEEDSS